MVTEAFKKISREYDERRDQAWRAYQNRRTVEASAKVRETEFQTAIDKAAHDLARDIVATKRELFPLGSEARLRRVERSSRLVILSNAIYKAINR